MPDHVFMPLDIVIYHNPECGTSRNTLARIRNAGIEPHVVEYLKTPPTRAMPVWLIDRLGLARVGCCARRARPLPHLVLPIPRSATASLSTR